MHTSQPLKGKKTMYERGLAQCLLYVQYPLNVGPCKHYHWAGCTSPRQPLISCVPMFFLLPNEAPSGSVLHLQHLAHSVNS